MQRMPSKNRKNKGSSPDLLPSIMGALDAFLIDTKHNESHDCPIKTSSQRTHHATNFGKLSANVQKILANVPDEDIVATPQRHNRLRQSMDKHKTSAHKSNESLDIISPNVQKLLSSFPESELVLCADDKRCTDVSDTDYKTGVCHSKSVSSGFGSINEIEEDSEYNFFNNKPLGSYMHKSSSGIASRTPTGRKNMGKYLQIPSESTNSTVSSEVSRPVSLTSLGSCSSSGSSGLHQQNSAYLASAESLDSDVDPPGSQGSADSGISESAVIKPETRVLQEVLDTESVYVEDLRQVIQGYLEPWKNDPECPLQQHLPYLFSNLEEIYEFNRSFLQDLSISNCDPTQTANVFLHNDSGFSVYTEYCTSYPRIMKTLTELTRDEKTSTLFRERQLALNHALPLGSYLLKPVQRILKYHVLLQRLSKQCDECHKPTVDLALTTMTGVATHINSMKRKYEHAVRVQEIQSQLYGWNGPDLTALGELIAEGIFRVGGARSRRHVFLFDKLLLMAKDKTIGALAYKSHIMCSNLMLVEQIRGEPLCFHVLPFDNPRLQCTLKARSIQQKREWTLQIKRVILENYSAVIPNHARQLVMQLGQEVEEVGDDLNNKWSPLKQHTRPHYLERRCRVRKSRDFNNRRATSQDRSFPTLTNWRRKSDPSGIQQYNLKTMPKKICKLKKAKDCSTVFYTDLSDCETCTTINASIDSLNTSEEHKQVDNHSPQTPANIAQVVNTLLMQNEDFHKLLNRQKRAVRDKDCTAIWNKSDNRLPSKADSLPRSFQLNENTAQNKVTNLLPAESISSLHENSIDNEDLPESETSLQLEDFPEHKIYRKSTIRFSLLQRFRAMISEEQKSSKLPSYKQGSRSMGAKIANPDYADPYEIFTTSVNESNTSLNKADIQECKTEMTINENEVLREVDERVNNFKSSQNNKSASMSQICTENTKTFKRCASDIFNSSQNCDYYESLLDKSLIEEEKTIDKSDSFRSNKSVTIIINKKEVKRPSNAPPPIPAKPKNLYSKNLVNNKNTISTTQNNTSHKSEHFKEFNQNSKGWVKTIVNRFE